MSVKVLNPPSHLEGEQVEWRQLGLFMSCVCETARSPVAFAQLALLHSLKHSLRSWCPANSVCRDPVRNEALSCGEPPSAGNFEGDSASCGCRRSSIWRKGQRGDVPVSPLACLSGPTSDKGHKVWGGNLGWHLCHKGQQIQFQLSCKTYSLRRPSHSHRTRRCNEASALTAGHESNHTGCKHRAKSTDPSWF